MKKILLAVSLAGLVGLVGCAPTRVDLFNQAEVKLNTSDPIEVNLAKVTWEFGQSKKPEPAMSVMNAAGKSLLVKGLTITAGVLVYLWAGSELLKLACEEIDEGDLSSCSEFD